MTSRTNHATFPNNPTRPHSAEAANRPAHPTNRAARPTNEATRRTSRSVRPTNRAARPTKSPAKARHPGGLPARATLLGLLTAMLLAELANPAAANQPGQHTPTTGVAAAHGVAARHANTGGSLTFAALCVVGIVLIAGCVLLYTAHTRRELPAEAH